MRNVALVGVGCSLLVACSGSSGGGGELAAGGTPSSGGGAGNVLSGGAVASTAVAQSLGGQNAVGATSSSLTSTGGVTFVSQGGGGPATNTGGRASLGGAPSSGGRSAAGGSSTQGGATVAVGGSSGSRGGSSSMGGASGTLVDVGAVTCQPMCPASAKCGSDQCGSVCGVCTPSELCSGGQCVPAGGSADIVVNTATPTHEIHREVYGVAFATKTQMADTAFPLNRFGGNATTRYNFKNNRSNSAADWYFLNGDQTSEGTRGSPSYLNFTDIVVRDALSVGGVPLITIPTIGWVAKDAVGTTKQCGYPKAKFPVQESFWTCNGADWCAPVCGNGKDLSQKEIPSDATMAALTGMQVGPEFAAEQAQRLAAKFGAAYADRLHYYALDNEPFLWHSTHRDVHPERVGYEEVWKKTVDYATAIRAADPKGRIMGYSTWGVADVADSSISQERQTKFGGTYLMEWYLQKLADYQKANGKRLIDCIDLHFYPYEDENDDLAMLNSPRTLWDPTYEVTSWIKSTFGSPNIRLIPRVREWIQKRYPGTGICMSEYNFYPKKPVSSLVQADVLGMYGREGITLGAWWVTPWDKDVKLPPYWAFRLYLNYDGKGGNFGNGALSTAVRTGVTDLSAYAAKRASDGAVTLVVINRGTASRTLSVELRGSTAKNVEGWYYRVNDSAITQASTVSVTGGIASLTVPARAMEIFVVK